MENESNNNASNGTSSEIKPKNNFVIVFVIVVFAVLLFLKSELFKRNQPTLSGNNVKTQPVKELTASTLLELDFTAYDRNTPWDA